MVLTNPVIKLFRPIPHLQQQQGQGSTKEQQSSYEQHCYQSSYEQHCYQSSHEQHGNQAWRPGQAH